MAKEKKQKKKMHWFDFLLNVTIVTLVVMASLHAIQPIITPPDPRIPEANRYVDKLIEIHPAELDSKIREDGPSIMLVYASWCGYCRVIVPELVKLINEKKLEGMQTLFVSLDQNKEDLSKYLVLGGYKDVFDPYMVLEGTSTGLVKLSAEKGGNYKGQIPYVGVFDKKGNLVAESLGMTNHKRLLDMVNKAMPASAKP
jgi:thiol-disulfide isomerase/thioredoxin